MLQWLKEQIDSLVVQNVENLRWSIYQSVDNTFVQFGSVLDERLADTIAATHGAIQTALHKHQGQVESVSEEIARLESVEKKMEVLETAIGQR
jgi:hypothetical protein